MKRYLFAVLFVVILALSLPNLSQNEWIEEIPSHANSEVEFDNHDVNLFDEQHPVHNHKFNLYVTLNRFPNQPLVFRKNSWSASTTKPMAEKQTKIMIDAGHGGRDPGSLGIRVKEEKLYTLSVANKVYGLLQQETSMIPVMTRIDDSFISTDDRIAMANRDQVDIFISIHANSFINKNTRGIETYYYNSNSIVLASVLHDQLVLGTEFPDRKVRQMDYRVIKQTIMPAALLEIGYISNVTEESIMISEDMQNKVAASIVEGIKQYIELES